MPIYRSYHWYSKEIIGSHLGAYLTGNSSTEFSGTKTFECPTNIHNRTSKSNGEDWYVTIYSGGQHHKISYGLNAKLHLFSSWVGSAILDKTLKKVVNIKSPSQTYSLGDGLGMAICNKNNGVEAEGIFTGDGYPYFYRMALRHNQKNNAGWFDGHVSSIGRVDMPTKSPDTTTGFEATFYQGK